MMFSRPQSREHQAYLQAVQESGGDVRKALPKIMQVAPTVGLQLHKAITEWDSADLTKKKNILELHSKQQERLGQLAGGVTDEGSYQKAIQQAATEELIPPEQAQQFYQTPYDPQTVKAFQQQALSTKEQLDQARDNLKQEEETRHHKADEAKQPVTEANLALRAVQGDQAAAAAQKNIQQGRIRVAGVEAQVRANAQAPIRDRARADKSYQFSSTQLDKVGAPIEAAVMRLGRLQDTLAQGTPQADALVAPELLTVMAGGQGSGLRMNEAEIARVIGGRSNWESLKAAVNKWSADPSTANSITPAQRQQIRALTNEVQRKLLAKQQTLDQARQDLINSDDPMQHRQIVAGARNKLTGIDQGAGQPAQTFGAGKLSGKAAKYGIAPLENQ